MSPRVPARAALAAFVCAFVFAAGAPGQELRIVSPNGGEQWRIGSEQEIVWESDRVGLVRIAYAVGPFDPLIDIAPSTDDDGRLTWVIPQTPTEKARLLIEELDGPGLDTSDGDFFILPELEVQAKLSVSASTDGEGSTLEVQPMVPFVYYVVARVDFADEQQRIDNGILAWEAALRQPPELLILSRTLRPERAVDVGPGDDNFVVGLGECVHGVVSPVVVVELEAMLLSERTDLVVAPGAATPTSFPQDPGPGWFTCLRPRELRRFETVDSLRINPSPLSPGMSTQLDLAVPNPFTNGTRLRFHLAQEGEVQLRIYDASGREIHAIDLGPRPIGPGSYLWGGTDTQGAKVSSGAYLVELRSAAVRDHARVVRLK